MRTIFGAAAIAASMSATAFAQPTSICLSVNGAPYFVSGQGTAQTEAPARSFAESQWRAKASSHGQAYQNWNKATGKNISCFKSGSPFKPSRTCTYIARPCT